jgi:hypothetical protein
MPTRKFSREAKRRKELKAHAARERLRAQFRETNTMPAIGGGRIPAPRSLWEIEKDITGEDRVPTSDVVTGWDRLARSALTLREGREYLDRIDNPKMHEIGKHLFPDPDAALRRAFPDPDAALRRAFEHYSLDPVNPFSWRTLLNYYAMVEFGFPPRRRGRRQTTIDKRELKQAAEAARKKLRIKHGRSRISDGLVAQELAKDPRYKSIGKAGLRKRLSGLSQD